MSATTPLTRTLKEAEDWTKTWQTNHPNLSKAFLIPADDLIACFNEMGLKVTTDGNGKLQVKADGFEPKVRAYLGTQDSGGECLLIVGTTTTDGSKYKDIIYPNGDGTNGTGIYDFTTPCPSDCDDSSLLYHKK
ncbi:hypothetical protein ACU8DI_02435 [Psychroserpens sp. BH13MA-6]